MTQPKINSQFIKTNIHPDSASLKAFGEAIETFNTNLLAVAPVNAVAASKDFTSFKLTAKTKGLVGNNISLTVVAPENTAELSIQVNGYEIVVTAAHDGTDVTTTGSDLVTALNAHAQAKLLVVASAGTSAALVAVAKTKLEDGVNGTCVPKAGVYFVDSSNLYIAIDQNLASDANWRRISVGSAY